MSGKNEKAKERRGYEGEERRGERGMRMSVSCEVRDGDDGSIEET